MAAVWLVAIAVELLTTGAHFDVAVRDVLIALSAYSLALLTEVRAESAQSVPSAALSMSSTALSDPGQSRCAVERRGAGKIKKSG